MWEKVDKKTETAGGQRPRVLRTVIKIDKPLLKTSKMCKRLDEVHKRLTISKGSNQHK